MFWVVVDWPAALRRERGVVSFWLSVFSWEGRGRGSFTAEFAEDVERRGGGGLDLGLGLGLEVGRGMERIVEGERDWEVGSGEMSGAMGT